MKTKKLIVLILTVLILGVFIMNLLYKPSSSDVYQVVTMLIGDDVKVVDDTDMFLRVTKSGFKMFSNYDDNVMEFKAVREISSGEYLPFSWSVIDDNLFFGRTLERVVESEDEVEFGKMKRFKVKYKDGVWPFNSDKLEVQLLDIIDYEVLMRINCKKR